MQSDIITIKNFLIVDNFDKLNDFFKFLTILYYWILVNTKSTVIKYLLGSIPTGKYCTVKSINKRAKSDIMDMKNA